MSSSQPHLINFPRLGEPGIGFISVNEGFKLVPFDVKRIFWTYYTPDSIVRGRHAHHNTEMVLVAAAGRILVTTEMLSGQIDTFVLEKPEVGLFLPKYCWHTMQYSHSAVQLVLASTSYDEKDYIRDYEAFKKLK